MRGVDTRADKFKENTVWILVCIMSFILGNIFMYRSVAGVHPSIELPEYKCERIIRD